MPVATNQLFPLLQQHFGVWVYSIDKSQLDYSPLWLSAIVGNKEQEILSPRAFLRLVHPHDRSKLLKKLYQLRRRTVAQFECEIRLMCSGAHFHRIEVRAVAAECDVQGVARLITGTATSIHARSLQEESLYDLCQKLQSSETRYRALLHDAKSPIIVADSDTLEIVDVNNAASTVSGYSKAELLSMSMHDLVDVPANCQNSACSDNGSKKDLEMRCKSGMKIVVDISCSNVSVQDRNLTQCIIHDVSLRKRTEDTLRYMASHDPLTGLPNRNLLSERLDEALQGARSNKHLVAVCFVDLNKFKQVNDIYGHDVGDIILKNFAARLSGSIRKSDTAARLGGDEFIFILDNIASPAAIIKIMEHVIQRLSVPYGVEENSIQLGCSIGVSIFPANGSDQIELLHTADKAMYHAKQNGLPFYLWPEAQGENGMPPSQN